MDTLWQDVRYGIRMLRKSPGFTAVTVLTLALGIGINTAIFSVLHAVLLRPLPYEDPDRVMRIDEANARGGIGVSPPNFQDFQQQNDSFEQIAAHTGNNFVLTGGGEPVRIEGLKISHNLFSLLGVKPLWPFMRIVVRAKSDPMKPASAVRSQVQALDKDQPVDKIRTLEAVVGLSIAARNFYTRLLGTFAALAMVLAFLGIYGVVSYSVAQRTQEIGIRMALGAGRSDVLRLVLAEGFGLSLAGVILGLLGAVSSTRVLAELLFEVRPTDPITFVAFSLLLVGAALLASYIPARRAAKVDPLVALRHE